MATAATWRFFKPPLWPFMWDSLFLIHLLFPEKRKLREQRFQPLAKETRFTRRAGILARPVKRQLKTGAFFLFQSFDPSNTKIIKIP